MPTFIELAQAIGSPRINTVGAACAIIGLILYSLAGALAYFLQHKEEIQSTDRKEFTFFLRPANAAQTFFNKFWGPVGQGWLGVLTWRSFSATLVFSVVLNVACISLILKGVPEDAPDFNLNLVSILFFSELWFLFCNFLGDLFSVNVTRWMLHKITTLKKKAWKYIFIDLTGIVLGYGVMLVPAFVVLQLSGMLFDNPNELIQAGMAGNVLIPFFLLIFGVSAFPSFLSVFALAAFLSITIPTTAYLFTFIVFNLGRRVYHWCLEERYGAALRGMRLLKSVGGYLSMVGTAILSIPPLVEALV